MDTHNVGTVFKEVKSGHLVIILITYTWLNSEHPTSYTMQWLTGECKGQEFEYPHVLFKKKHFVISPAGQVLYAQK